ncbi:MAG: hypothetical protein M1546_20810 [Chloroflexi bacterium]|nr:hypothetical protein [Chloroflexota bacterium]
MNRNALRWSRLLLGSAILLGLLIAGVTLFLRDRPADAAFTSAVYTLPGVGRFRLWGDQRSVIAQATAPDGRRVWLARAVAGELDGDTAPSGAVVLVVTGSSESHAYLVASLSRNGALMQADAVSLGEGVEVQSMAIHDRQVMIEYKVHVPGDLPCCASRFKGSTFRLNGEKLELAFVPAGE